MENASKALIIAGAILLAILIIALGVFIFQRAQNSASDLGGLDETKVQSVNQKYENYEGTSVSGSDVKALIDLVRTNNNTYGVTADNPGGDQQNRRIVIVARNIGTGAGVINGRRVTAEELAGVKNAVVPGFTYTVTITDHHDEAATRGLVQDITIEQN